MIVIFHHPSAHHQPAVPVVFNQALCVQLRATANREILEIYDHHSVKGKYNHYNVIGWENFHKGREERLGAGTVHDMHVHHSVFGSELWARLSLLHGFQCSMVSTHKHGFYY